MNKLTKPYINYLLDHEPSPFCEYIVCKELLESDEKEIDDLLDWAKRFDLYNEIKDEQLPDGSWGGFSSRLTEQSKGRHYKTTGNTINRICDLSIDIRDEMVKKAVDVMRKYLSGEIEIPDSWGANNDSQPVIVRRDIIQSLSRFQPDDQYVTELRSMTAERAKESFRNGSFDVETWRKTDINPTIADYTQHNMYMLSHGNCIDEDLQEKLLKYEWDNMYFGIVCPSKLMLPEESNFHFWLISLERLKDFSLFSKFSESDVTPHLISICNQLLDERIPVNIFANRYHYHYGQYSESWRSPIFKRRDLMLRIIRILEKCK